MGWWSEKSYEDIPEKMRKNSAAVVSEAVERGIPNAPRNLQQIPPPLREEEDIVITGIDRGWWRSRATVTGTMVCRVATWKTGTGKLSGRRRVTVTSMVSRVPPGLTSRTGRLGTIQAWWRKRCAGG
eukprot:g11331.t1